MNYPHVSLTLGPNDIENEEGVGISKEAKGWLLGIDMFLLFPT